MDKFLEDRVVILRPNPRKGGMIKDKNHIGFFRYNGTYESFMLPADDHNGGLKEIFSGEPEREFFAKKLGIESNELNVRKNDNYFYNFQVKILKDDNLMTQGKVFDLSDPVDNLKYRILVNSGRVAPSFDKRYYSGGYAYYFVEKDHREKSDLSEIEIVSKVWEKYNSMKDSSTKMYEFLFLYWLKTKKASAPPKNPTVDYCKVQIKRIIDIDPKGYLDVFTSPSLKDEMMVYKGIGAGLIDYDGSIFLNTEKAEIGRTMKDVIHFYSNPINSAERLKLVANLREINKKEK